MSSEIVSRVNIFHLDIVSDMATDIYIVLSVVSKMFYYHIITIWNDTV